jgi:hypothetical protein
MEWRWAAEHREWERCKSRRGEGFHKRPFHHLSIYSCRQPVFSVFFSSLLFFLSLPGLSPILVLGCVYCNWSSAPGDTPLIDTLFRTPKGPESTSIFLSPFSPPDRFTETFFAPSPCILETIPRVSFAHEEYSPSQNGNFGDWLIHSRPPCLAIRMLRRHRHSTAPAPTARFICHLAAS